MDKSRAAGKQDSAFAAMSIGIRWLMICLKKFVPMNKQIPSGRSPEGKIGHYALREAIVKKSSDRQFAENERPKQTQNPGSPPAFLVGRKRWPPPDGIAV